MHISSADKKEKPWFLKALKTRRNPFFDKIVRKTGFVQLKMNPRLVEVASISSKIKHVSAKYVLHHIELSLLYLIRFWISSTDGSCFSSSSGSLLVT